MVDLESHAPSAGSPLARAALVVSIDVEMSWGQIHRPDRDYEFAAEREQMRRLLDVFDEYRVPATWAFVGHLLLDGCSREGGAPHPDLIRPDYDWFEGDWLAADPCTTAADAPTWYAPDLLSEVMASEVGHEVGSHSFTHLIAGDPGCSEAAFRSDLRRCRVESDRHGLELRSFIFPRNQYGHEHILAEEGFTTYRGPRSDPYAGSSDIVRRARDAAEMVAPTSKSAVVPVFEYGVWNLPATYLHDVGDPRRYTFKIAQAKRRLRQAVSHRGLFHLWFHPHNVQHEPERWFDGLAQLLDCAATLRAEGKLETLTMAQVAERLGSPAPATGSSAPAEA
ncbi:MAG: polysaccharide deacetylase family protein [Acidimicrobiia bacterium]|nr:polysaccharide deacetylase family protein [Acidimicrobiia bacterium]